MGYRLPTLGVFPYDWFVGNLLISQAFYGLPPDIGDMPLRQWIELVKFIKKQNAELDKK
jgi:hypothetical protein